MGEITISRETLFTHIEEGLSMAETCIDLLEKEEFNAPESRKVIERALASLELLRLESRGE